jgi:hypothetical protein
MNMKQAANNATWRYDTGDKRLHNHSRNNIKPYKLLKVKKVTNPIIHNVVRPISLNEYRQLLS